MNVRFFALIVIVVILSGCSHKKYGVKKLAPLTKETATFCKTQKQITVKARKWNSNDSQNFFYGTDLLTAKTPIQPVQITIENNRSLPVSCVIHTKNGVKFGVKKAAEQLYLSRWGVVGMSLAGIAVGGTSLYAGFSLAFITKALVIPQILILGGVSAFVLFPLIALHNRATNNQHIDQQIALNRLYNENWINPEEHLNGLVYCTDSAGPDLKLYILEEGKVITLFEDIIS